MITDESCRYCSVATKAAGVDPIGSAGTAHRWLFIEVPRPWSKGIWNDKPQLAALLPVFEQIRHRPKLWLNSMVGAIAPDADYSRPGHTWALSYQRPDQPFTQFTAVAYCLPTAQVAALAQALLLQPQQLPRFDRYRQDAPTRDLLVCTHTHYDVACGRFGTPLYKRLRQDYGSDQLRVWQTSHFGGHQFAPTLADFPSGRFWGYLEPEVLDALIHQRGEVAQLRPFYRGWGGCAPWAQVLERELWMREGWRWSEYRKSARVVAKDPGKLTHRLLRWILPWIPTIRAQVLLKKLEQKLTWARVEMQYSHPDKGHLGTDAARVEVSHQVLSQLKSGEDQPMYPVKQYRVTDLTVTNQGPNLQH
ncbi:MAG: sucrase ferredoxin [Cyanobacteria bacterium P01_A01_bin.135]